jgi:hypothetical protein
MYDVAVVVEPVSAQSMALYQRKLKAKKSTDEALLPS